MSDVFCKQCGQYHVSLTVCPNQPLVRTCNVSPPEAPDPWPLVRELRDALKKAARLIDELGASPLELAAKYGPDYEPPGTDTLVEMRDAVEEEVERADAFLMGAGGAANHGEDVPAARSEGGRP